MSSYPENHSQIDPLVEIPFDDQQWWLDTADLADTILEQKGEDRTDEDCDLWVANWSVHELQKDFRLNREQASGGGVDYWLNIHPYAGIYSEGVYAFDSEVRGVSFVSGPDVNDAYNLPDRNFALEFLSYRLSNYLITANVRLSGDFPFPPSPLMPREEKAFRKLAASFAVQQAGRR